MKANLFSSLIFVFVTLYSGLTSAATADLSELQQASSNSSAIQSKIAELQKQSHVDLERLGQLRSELQRAKNHELNLYRRLVSEAAEQEYASALAAQDVEVSATAECKRIMSDRDCLAQAQKEALASAAKEGGHYFIVANTEQTNTRSETSTNIDTSSEFNETVSMRVSAHIVGFTVLEEKVSPSPFSSMRIATTNIKAQVAGQPNEQLKQSLQQQAQRKYAAYLSDNELTTFADHNRLQLSQLELQLVQIPAGQVIFGDNKGDRNERPQQLRSVSGFYLSQLEITRQLYNKCIRALRCSREEYKEDLFQPATELSWLEITEEFLPWASVVTGYELRLPTELEWEFAAKRGLINQPLCQKANGNLAFSPCDDGYKKLAPVGSFAANRFGLHDMQGNAAEWTASCWRFDHSKQSRIFCNKAVIKGGSWYNKAHYLRVSSRFGKSKTSKLDTLGFRIATSL